MQRISGPLKSSTDQRSLCIGLWFKTTSTMNVPCSYNAFYIDIRKFTELSVSSEFVQLKTRERQLCLETF